MKKTFLFILGFLCLVSLGFSDDIWTLNFESSGGYSTSVVEFTDSGGDYFIRSDGSNIGSWIEYNNLLGSYFYGAQDTDGDGGPDYLTLSIDDISISTYTTLVFKVYLAEDDASDALEDWDDNTWLHISYDIDNTGSFTNLIWVEATGGTNSTPRIDSDFDGVGDGTEITPTFTEFIASIVGTGSVIDILVEFNYLDAGDEDIAIDNLLITGTPSGGVSDPTSFTATTYANDQINLTWLQNGNSDDVMVAWTSDGVFGTPVDGTSYSAGNSIIGGGTVLYNGSNLLYNHTSLNSDTQYFYKAWSVDSSTDYSSGVIANATTFKDEPSNHVTDFMATTDGFSRIDLGWTENDGSVVPDGYLIKASTADNVSNPVDGIAIADNAIIGNDSGAINLAHGTSIYEWTGLDAETTYYFKIYPYTNSGFAIDYKTDGTVPSANATTEVMPAIPELLISEVADPSDNYNARFVELYNSSGSTINFDTRAVWYLSRQANGLPGSWGDVQLTGSISSGSIYIIALNQTAFETAFGMSANLYSNIITGNGDDGYFLYYGGDHSTGILSDAYGVIDVDGTGEAWEYLDSHAERNAGVTEPSATWLASEYTIESATAAQCTPGDSPLPVTLTSFTAQFINDNLTILWTTQSETNNLGWNIYRGETENALENNTTFCLNNSGLIPGAGTTSEPTDYQFTDEYDVIVGQTYWYWLESIDGGGNTDTYGPATLTVLEEEPIPQLPQNTFLCSNYPNPFNPETKIEFSIKEGENGSLTIYNAKGQLLETHQYEVGEHKLTWDAIQYGSGIYFYKLETQSYTETKKMIMLK
jgi:hypothetical protein